MESLLLRVSDPNLRFALSFGIGLHHAGLGDRDRKVVEELFVNQKIHVIIKVVLILFSSWRVPVTFTLFDRSSLPPAP